MAGPVRYHKGTVIHWRHCGDCKGLASKTKLEQENIQHAIRAADRGLCTGDSHRATEYFTQTLAISLLWQELHAAHACASTPLSRPAASIDTLCTKIVYISYPYKCIAMHPDKYVV
jgi:hypothetical protein